VRVSEIREVELPAHSLLDRYAGGDGFADAYAVDVDRAVTLETYVQAFYSTRLFGLERLVLSMLGRRSSFAQLRAMASGEQQRFAAWTVEARADAQLLLADDTGRTRSWLKCESLPNGGTRLYFGSAVVARVDPRTGKRSLGPVFGALLGFHRGYSRALLRAARKALLDERPRGALDRLVTTLALLAMGLAAAVFSMVHLDTPHISFDYLGWLVWSFILGMALFIIGAGLWTFRLARHGKAGRAATTALLASATLLALSAWMDPLVTP